MLMWTARTSLRDNYVQSRIRGRSFPIELSRATVRRATFGLATATKTGRRPIEHFRSLVGGGAGGGTMS